MHMKYKKELGKSANVNFLVRQILRLLLEMYPIEPREIKRQENGGIVSNLSDLIGDLTN